MFKLLLWLGMIGLAVGLAAEFLKLLLDIFLAIWPVFLIIAISILVCWLLVKFFQIRKKNRLAEKLKEAPEETFEKIPCDLNALLEKEGQSAIETELELQEFMNSYVVLTSFFTRVVGVSYLNDDGSSRQEILSHCLCGEPVGFYWHTFEGKPACAVISEHGQIGYLKADLAADLHADYIAGNADNLIVFSSTISDITGGDRGLSYGCNIMVSVFAPKQSAISEQARPSSALESPYFTYGGVDGELLNVDLMDGHNFEYWCASLLKNIGFQSADVTQASGDDGVDILAEKDGVRYAIQCKRYNSDLGNKPIQEVHTGKAVYNCHVGAVMTNRYFTEGGKRAAAATRTLLWDRDWLRERLGEVQAFAVEKPADPLLSPEEVEGNEMLPVAVDVILETGQASVSMLQRRLNIGYARAARLLDELEDKGFVGPFQGSKPRAVLITKQQWNLRKRQ